MRLNLKLNGGDYAYFLADFEVYDQRASHPEKASLDIYRNRFISKGRPARVGEMALEGDELL